MRNLLFNGGGKRSREKIQKMTNSDFDTRAFNGSLRSKLSDFDQEDIADQETEEVVGKDLGDFMKFKIISNDKALVILKSYGLLLISSSWL